MKLLLIIFLCQIINIDMILAQKLEFKVEQHNQFKKKRVNRISILGCDLYILNEVKLYKSSNYGKNFRLSQEDIHSISINNHNLFKLRNNGEIIKGKNLFTKIDISLAKNARVFKSGNNQVVIGGTQGLKIITPIVNQFFFKNINIYKTFIDKEKNIWVGTENLKLEVKLHNKTKFKTVKKHIKVSAITENKNYIWVSETGYLWRINKNNLHIKSQALPDILLQQEIEDMLIDIYGNLWVCSQVVAYRNKKGEWKIFGNGEGFTSRQALCMAECKADSSIWVGTAGKGLFRFKINKSKESEKVLPLKTDSAKLISNKVNLENNKNTTTNTLEERKDSMLNKQIAKKDTIQVNTNNVTDIKREEKYYSNFFSPDMTNPNPTVIKFGNQKTLDSLITNLEQHKDLKIVITALAKSYQENIAIGRTKTVKNYFQALIDKHIRRKNQTRDKDKKIEEGKKIQILRELVKRIEIKTGYSYEYDLKIEKIP